MNSRWNLFFLCSNNCNLRPCSFSIVKEISLWVLDEEGNINHESNCPRAHTVSSLSKWNLDHDLFLATKNMCPGWGFFWCHTSGWDLAVVFFFIGHLLIWMNYRRAKDIHPFSARGLNHIKQLLKGHVQLVLKLNYIIYKYIHYDI